MYRTIVYQSRDDSYLEVFTAKRAGVAHIFRVRVARVNRDGKLIGSTE